MHCAFVHHLFNLERNKMISDFAKEKVFWTKKMNSRLVKFIASKPSIWNPKHPKYTSVNHRDRTYAEFASKYGDEFTGQAVKDRWTNIRSTFANYVRKVDASSKKGEEYKVNWHLWEPCQFLMKVNKKGQLELSTLQESSEEDDHQDTAAVDDSQDICQQVADNLVKILEGVQNNAFSLEQSKYGRFGLEISKTLSQMNSYDAAKLSLKIMEILLLYDKNNAENPNATPLKIEFEPLITNVKSVHSPHPSFL